MTLPEFSNKNTRIMTKLQMEERLKNAFVGAQIEVIDLTGGEDHWEVSVTSSAFTGLTRVAQQRLVMDAFKAELKTGEVHALTIKTKIN